MHAIKENVTIVTASDGTGIGYTSVLNGRVLSIIYSKAGSGSYTDGVDFDITGETTGQIIWDQDNVNASAQIQPRQATHSTAGAASLYAAAGTAVNDFIYIANERIKISIANGGDTHTGTFTVLVG